MGSGGQKQGAKKVFEQNADMSNVLKIGKKSDWPKFQVFNEVSKTLS